MDFWGAPCRQDEHQVSSFYVKMRRFFFNFGTFLQEKSEPNTFDRNHRLKSPGQELKSKNSLARFKVTPITFGLYVPAFWMSSCRKPACPLFLLEQELHIKGEQVKYFKIQVSFVAFRSIARGYSRHPSDDHIGGRRVAEFSVSVTWQ